jgi:hypothetical protein
MRCVIEGKGKGKGSAMNNAGQRKFFFIQSTAAAAALGLVWLAAAAPASAFTPQATPEQQQACTPDAERLCSEFIPDAGKVAACMSRKRSQLSPVCRAAFTTPSHEHRRPIHHHRS